MLKIPFRSWPDLARGALIAFLCALIVIAPSTSVAGDSVDVGAPSNTCPDSQLFSAKLISDICWGCIFPLRIMGINLGGGNAPDGASSSPFCMCNDGPIPKPGMSLGYWEPARIVETVRKPGCSPSLGGITLPGADRRRQAAPGYRAGSANMSTGMYHYRYYAFPLLLMMDLFAPGSCFSDGIQDFDLMYISEMDPTWNNDQLAFFTNPEAAAVANLPAQSACTIDAAITATGTSDDTFWWCAGAWGSMYPLSGQALGTHFTNMTSLLSARAIGALHRRGMALRTMGDSAVCRSVVEPMVPKSQYRLSMFFPTPEARSNHVIGETTISWGSNRMVPVAGEDASYIVWRWNDCCMLF